MAPEVDSLISRVAVWLVVVSLLCGNVFFFFVETRIVEKEHEWHRLILERAIDDSSFGSVEIGDSHTDMLSVAKTLSSVGGARPFSVTLCLVNWIFFLVFFSLSFRKGFRRAFYGEK